jgi:hypothetical protein
MSTNIDYASPEVATPQGPSTARSITLLLLTALALFTCLRIEYLNWRHNFYLPRDFTTDVGTWRTTSPKLAYKYAFERMARDDPTILTRPLTPFEANTLAQIAEHARINSDLCDVVSTLGILQYPLTFILLFTLSVTAYRHHSKSWQRVLWSAFIVNLACMALMFYRGYFTSLGF